MKRRQLAVAASVVYGVGVVYAYRQSRSYGVLKRPVCAAMAVGWPGIVAGVGIAYATRRDRWM